LLLSQAAKKKGYKVTLLLGPVEEKIITAGINLKRFRYYDEFFALIKKELSTKKYDIVIHAAAVADYQPVKTFNKKLKSSGNLTLTLKTTPKILERIKKFDKNVFLVTFKLESEGSQANLIKKARRSLIKAKSDLVVANKIYPRYKSFIVDNKNIYAKAFSKLLLARKLFEVIEVKKRQI